MFVSQCLPQRVENTLMITCRLSQLLEKQLLRDERLLTVWGNAAGVQKGSRNTLVFAYRLSQLLEKQLLRDGRSPMHYITDSKVADLSLDSADFYPSTYI